jgi:hypothetical protein
VDNDNDNEGQRDIKEKAICLETDRNDRFPDEPIVREMYKSQ